MIQPPPPPPPVANESPEVEIRAWRPRRPKRRLRIPFSAINHLAALAVTITSFVLIYRQVSSGNFERLVAVLSRQELQEPVQAERQVERPTVGSIPRRETRPTPSRPVSSRVTSREKDEQFQPVPLPSKTLAPLLAEEQPAESIIAKVSIDVSDGRQMVELPADAKTPLRIARISGLPSGEVLPGEGGLSSGGKVEIRPFGESHPVRLVARMAEPVDGKQRLMIEARTAGDVLLTEDRMKRMRLTLMKQLNAAIASRNAAAAELKKLGLYVQSSGTKPLQTVRAARNRILVLNEMIGGLNAQVEIAKSNAEQFDQICQMVISTLKNAEIELAADGPAEDANATASLH